MSAKEDVVLNAPVWSAEHHRDDWNSTVGADDGVIAECCAGAATILKRMNPDQYQMSLGTRVVCIKTQLLDNVHIAMQNGIWITSDRVGEKINRVYLDHDVQGGEKVLFIFSINRQRSFCALAEMNGLWTQGGGSLAGWQETAGSFSVVGTIPVTFTHVKNVANEHFSHINHENPNQPITNMWNGMHFQPDKGRDVVKIFHEKAHFTNVLCRDKRKSYDPFDPVSNAQELDPRLSHKFMVPPNGNNRGRGGYTQRTLTNWRHGEASEQDKSTPTRAPLPKRLTHDNGWGHPALAPIEPRTMNRAHVPAPLRIRNTTEPSRPDFSPRPGQLIQCIVDENGNYVPVTPSSATLHGSPATVRPAATNSPLPTARHQPLGRAQDVMSAHQSNTQIVSGDGRGNASDREGYHRNLQPKSSVPRLTAQDNELTSPSHNLRRVKTTQNLARDTPSKQSGGRTSSASMLEAAVNATSFVPGGAQPQGAQSTDTSALLAAKADPAELIPHIAAKFTPGGMYPPTASQYAHLRNNDILSYETMRRQALNNPNPSPSSTLHSEYKDWASTSEVERQRITPLSPLSGDKDPFLIDSISKGASPSYKAYQASVNREQRTLRHGQRALPIPAKFNEQPETLNTVARYNVQSMIDGLPRPDTAQTAVSAPVMNDQAPIPSSSSTSHPATGLTGYQGSLQSSMPVQREQAGDLSPLSGFSQLPSSMIHALNSAGQYAPNPQNDGHPVDARAMQHSNTAPLQTPTRALPQSDGDHGGIRLQQGEVVYDHYGRPFYYTRPS